MVAYDVPDEEMKRPAWLADTCYDISAKIPTGTGPERVPSMLQQMLADRFGLRVHWESATVKGYKLVVARGGPKLTQAKKTGPDAPSRRATFRGADVEIHFDGMTMEQFARVLSRYTGRTTVDATNLAGAYDIAFECSMESIAIFSGTNESDDAMPGPSLYSAVHNLGLNLVSGAVPQRRLVVDAASRVPTPDLSLMDSLSRIVRAVLPVRRPESGPKGSEEPGSRHAQQTHSVRADGGVDSEAEHPETLRVLPGVARNSRRRRHRRGAEEANRRAS
jgi:uncharacterized protein (TIGR03435 family)